MSLVVDAVIEPTDEQVDSLSINLSKGLVQNFGNGSIQDQNLELVNQPTARVTAKIPCSDGDVPFGTTCVGSPGIESVGVAFVPPQPGRYLACVSFTHFLHYLPHTTGLGGSTQFAIVETPRDSDDAPLQGFRSVFEGGTTTDQSLGQRLYQAHRLCDTFVFADVRDRVLRLLYRQLGYNPADKVQANAVHVKSNGLEIGVHWEVYFAGE